jgi:hypothetical protein
MTKYKYFLLSYKLIMEEKLIAKEMEEGI